MDAKFRWFTSNHLKRTIKREHQLFNDPICTDVLWSFRHFRRVDDRPYDPLFMISYFGGDTIGFGSEAEFDASRSNISKRGKYDSTPICILFMQYQIELYSIGVGNIDMVEANEYTYLQISVGVDTKPSVPSHIQWFHDDKPLVDNGSTVNGATTCVLALVSPCICTTRLIIY